MSPARFGAAWDLVRLRRPRPAARAGAESGDRAAAAAWDFFLARARWGLIWLGRVRPERAAAVEAQSDQKWRFRAKNPL